MIIRIIINGCKRDPYRKLVASSVATFFTKKYTAVTTSTIYTKQYLVIVFDIYSRRIKSSMAIPSFNWRLVYFISIGLRFVFALSNSYIHPDEHFQSLEVMTSRILGYSANIPWELASDAPARSLAPLYLIYGPILYSIKLLGLHLSPLQIWYLVRLQNVVVGWIITDMCIYRVLPTKPERIKAILFTLTSYVTLVYQSHLFSNSIETYLLIIAVMIIDNIRYIDESHDPRVKRISQSTELTWLGVIISIGTFNRITFPAFLVFPSWFVVKYLWRNKTSTFFVIAGFTVTTALFIAIDTVAYAGALQSTPNYIITPLNNLLYNTNYLNLAQHGIHPFYTHIFINLPQILGLSGILLLFYKLKNQYYLTVPFLSASSGIFFLSCIPHQELRFLIPIVPLLCCCFDMSKFVHSKTEKTEQAPKTTWINVLLYEWYAFNIIMAILMGVFHQGGVVPALDHLQTSPHTFQVWWRTYSPPTWMLGDQKSSIQVITLNDENFHLGYSLDPSKSTYIFDTMGSDYDKVANLLQELGSRNKTLLITPTASYSQFKNSYKQLWTYNYHVDMDHLDFSNIDTLKPGLGIYEV